MGQLLRLEMLKYFHDSQGTHILTLVFITQDGFGFNVVHLLLQNLWYFIQLEKGQEHQVVCVRFIERKVQDRDWSWTLFTPCESHVSQPSEQVFLSCVSNTSVCCPYFLTLPCFAFSIAKKFMWLVLSDLKVWWKFIHWIIQYESVWSSAEIIWHLCSVRHCYTQMH